MTESLGNGLALTLVVLIVTMIVSLLYRAIHSLSRRRRWDFFISYKSENANEVRRIVERLISAGCRVWFAEYEVLLRNYDEFESRMAEGTKNCSFGLVFTTSGFSQSKHCSSEVASLQKHFAGDSHRLIEVSLETNDARDALGFSPDSPQVIAKLRPTSCEPNEDIALVTKLEELTGMVLNRNATFPTEGATFQARCAPITFEAPGLVLDKRRTHPLDDTDVFSFRSQTDLPRVTCDVQFHYSPQRAPGQSFTLGSDPLDNRKRYDELRDYAMWFMAAVRSRGMLLKERGLHLVWTGQQTQLAISHSFLWYQMRKYSVIRYDTQEPLQIVFSFVVTGDLSDLCRVVPLMDRVVESVRVIPVDRRSGRRVVT